MDLLLGRNDPSRAKRVIESLPQESLSASERLAYDQAHLRLLEFGEDDQQVDQALIAYRSNDLKNSFAVERLLDRRLCNASTTKIPSNAELINDLKLRQPTTQATWQYYEARLALAKEDVDVGKVQTLLASLTNRLPYWSRTQELAGRLAAKEGNTRDARLAYVGAVAKPDPNPELLKLLIDDNERGGDHLANIQMLEKYRQMPALSRTLSNGHWTALQRRLDFASVDRGLRRIHGDGSVMWSALVGNKLVDDADDVASLMLSLWQAGEAKRNVEDYLTAIEHLTFETSDERAFVLGQAYQLAGRFQEAKQQYRKVLDDSEQRLQAEIYTGTASIQSLRARARAADLAELQSQAKTRLEAVMKLRRSGRNDLEAAQGLLESLVGSPKADATDRILLANCFEQLGNSDAAIRQLERVVEADATAYHVSILTDFLLRAGQYDKAEIWIDQLEEQTGWEKKTVLLRTRWMVATNRIAEIRPFVEMFAAERFKSSPRNPAAEIRDVSDIYRQAGLYDDAERWLKTLANRFPNQAEPWSRLLVEHDETDRAIQRCIEQLHDKPTVETATLLARILVYGKVNPTTLDRVLPLLDDCLDRYPDDPSFLFALGNVHIRLAEKSQAIDLLSRVTQLQPGHYLAWNNLAAVLAEEEGRQDEAMATIEKAIEQAAYEIPTLLDTKAVVLMHQDRFQAAASLLRQDVTQSRAGTDPRFFFHLAMCMERLNDKSAAQEALAEALSLDLDRSFLTEFEQAELDRMTAELAEDKE